MQRPDHVFNTPVALQLLRPRACRMGDTPVPLAPFGSYWPFGYATAVALKCHARCIRLPKKQLCIFLWILDCNFTLLQLKHPNTLLWDHQTLLWMLHVIFDCKFSIHVSIHVSEMCTKSKRFLCKMQHHVIQSHNSEIRRLWYQLLAFHINFHDIFNPKIILSRIVWRKKTSNRKRTLIHLSIRS